jgi:hypothetical protein
MFMKKLSSVLEENKFLTWRTIEEKGCLQES